MTLIEQLAEDERHLTPHPTAPGVFIRPDGSLRLGGPLGYVSDAARRGYAPRHVLDLPGVRTGRLQVSPAV